MDKKLTKAEISFIGQLLAAISVESFRKLLTDHILNAFIVSHNNTNIEFNFGGSKPDPNTIDYIKEREIILSDKTASKLEGDLKYELITALQNNESISQITRRLDKIFTDMMPWQLERIARSEVIDAQNAGRISAYKASDVVEYKMWIAAKGGKGERVCDLCVSMHGQIRPVDKPFVNPNNSAESWQHPICHPNGRCTTVPLMGLPDKVITINGLTYEADEKVGKIEIPINLLKSQDKTVIKVEVNTESLNKKEITVRGFHDKRGVWHKPHKRMIKVKLPAETSKEAVSKEVVPGKEPISMTQDNVDKILSLKDFGIKGGVHHRHTDIIRFKDKSHAIYKRMHDEDVTFGEVSAYKVNEIIGWDVIPETMGGDFGKGDGSVQRIIGDIKEPCSPTRPPGNCVRIEEQHMDDLAKIFVMDLIRGSNDRHAGNVIIRDDKLYSIDNEFANDPNLTSYSLISLDELEKTEIKDGVPRYSDHDYTTPMFEWLKLSEYDYPDLYNRFKSLVVKNAKDAVSKKSEIVKYYHDDETSKQVGFDKDLYITDNIIDNFKYIEKYIGENE